MRCAQALEAANAANTAAAEGKRKAVDACTDADTKKRDAEKANAAREGELREVERRLAIEKAKPKPKTFDAGAGAQKGAAQRRGAAAGARSPSRGKSPKALLEGSRVLRKQISSGRNLLQKKSAQSSGVPARLFRLPRNATAGSKTTFDYFAAPATSVSADL